MLLGLSLGQMSEPLSTASVTTILGVPISRLGFEDTIRLCEERVKKNAGGFVCFTNVHTVTESTHNADLRKSLGRAFLCAPDGLPLVWFSKLKMKKISERVCGPDFTPAFLTRFPNFHHGFIGGQPGQAKNIIARFALDGVSVDTPVRPFSRENAIDDWNQFLARFRAERPDSQFPDVVWIGLGAPKQELWMNTISPLAPSTLFFGVGAAFDFLTEGKTRAPRWMQKSGTEWIYRFAQEPGRLWKRYLIGNWTFLKLGMRELFTDAFKK